MWKESLCVNINLQLNLYKRQTNSIISIRHLFHTEYIYEKWPIHVKTKPMGVHRTLESQPDPCAMLSIDVKRDLHMSKETSVCAKTYVCERNTWMWKETYTSQKRPMCAKETHECEKRHVRVTRNRYHQPNLNIKTTNSGVSTGHPCHMHIEYVCEKRLTLVKRDLCVCIEAHECEKRPVRVTRNRHHQLNLNIQTTNSGISTRHLCHIEYVCEKRPIHVKRDLCVCKETHECEKRPVWVKRNQQLNIKDLKREKRPMFVNRSHDWFS